MKQRLITDAVTNGHFDVHKQPIPTDLRRYCNSGTVGLAPHVRKHHCNYNLTHITDQYTLCLRFPSSRLRLFKAQ